MVTAVVGANWGDEGKGKITDMLAQEADIIVRFQGGANAGHTIVNDYGKFALHTLPSGVFYDHTTSIIGNGVALNIPVFFKEYQEVVDRGVPAPKIMISDRAQIVMPYHILFDQYEEERLGGKSFGLHIPHISEVSIPRLAQGGFVRANTPQLAMIGDNRHQGEIVAPEDKMQAMVDRAVAMASNQNMTDQYLLMMIDLLKRIIEVIQALDLTVNIDIRDIKNKLKQLEDRSGYPLRG